MCAPSPALTAQSRECVRLAAFGQVPRAACPGHHPPALCLRECVGPSAPTDTRGPSVRVRVRRRPQTRGVPQCVGLLSGLRALGYRDAPCSGPSPRVPSLVPAVLRPLAPHPSHHRSHLTLLPCLQGARVPTPCRCAVHPTRRQRDQSSGAPAASPWSPTGSSVRAEPQQDDGSPGPTGCVRRPPREQPSAKQSGKENIPVLQ